MGLLHPEDPLLLVIPATLHFAPLYFGILSLSFYLRCGVTFDWGEAVLPRLGSTSRASITSITPTPP